VKERKAGKKKGLYKRLKRVFNSPSRALFKMHGTQYSHRLHLHCSVLYQMERILKKLKLFTTLKLSESLRMQKNTDYCFHFLPRFTSVLFSLFYNIFPSIPVAFPFLSYSMFSFNPLRYDSPVFVVIGFAA
jgi:hypothetical protein